MQFARVAFSCQRIEQHIHFVPIVPRRFVLFARGVLQAQLFEVSQLGDSSHMSGALEEDQIQVLEMGQRLAHQNRGYIVINVQLRYGVALQSLTYIDGDRSCDSECEFVEIRELLETIHCRWHQLTAHRLAFR